MIVDHLLLFSDKQDLTQAQAGTETPSTNTIDLSQLTDLSPTENITIFAVFSSLPVGEEGAKLTISVDVSDDNQNWTTLETVPDIDITKITQSRPFAVRTKPASVDDLYRYIRLTYTPSAALTAGMINAGINLNVPVQHSYAKNYSA